MSWKTFLALFSATLILVAPACSLVPGSSPNNAPPTNPSGSTSDLQTQVAVIVASTYSAQTAQALANATINPQQPGETPEFTFTPTLGALQSVTFTPSVTLTPTSTLSSSVPIVSVSSDTNIRTGPGISYDRLDVMKPGQTAEVIGIYAVGGYWIIRLPNAPNSIGWLWGQYATVVGNTSGLPVYPAPPTPTPRPTSTITLTPTSAATFNVIYSSTTICSGNYDIKFQITNNGNVTWESNRTTVKDTVTSETVSLDRDVFPYFDGCTQGTTDHNLDPGEIGITTSAGLTADPAGHKIKATIRLCSKNGMIGTCMEKSITFTP